MVRKIRIRTDVSEEEKLESVPCPICGVETVWEHYSSSSWTWKNNCGREGMIRKCPNCGKVVRHHLYRMS
jgi:endogenous inhibitor of DNA gyrase (YacG/DUF329 family)